MAVTTRFAPSPTGPLHAGHALAALVAWRAARRSDGRFLLRIEDLDRTRCRDEHVAAIAADLAWLGIAWDGAALRQSTRRAAYRDALARLRAAGLLYPCFCTRADIVAAASAPHGPDGALYPGTCRALSAAERAARAADAPHAWRLDMAAAGARAGRLTWHDAAAGEVVANPAAAGDIVLARRDGVVAYHLAVVVDDAHQGVTLVTRGCDLFAATHVHRLLQALLGLAVPCWHHHALVVGADGVRLAKRDRATSLAALRAAAVDGAAMGRDLLDLADADDGAIYVPRRYTIEERSR